MSGRAARNVVERIMVAGTLVLDTPAHLGNGDVAGLTDMPLLRDPLEGKQPLLTGASIAGALRSYLREYEHGYGAPEAPNDRAQRLFGRVEGQASLQSWLLVDDSLGESPGVELRDGVAIDPATRTAKKEKKFDIELLEAGTTFPLSFELLLGPDGSDQVDSLALALHGLERGEIGLGMRKRRGLGECRVTEWRVRRYRLTEPAGLLAWLADDRSSEVVGAEILPLLGAKPAVTDRRRRFRIDATFELASSLLIRSGAGAGDDPDMVHLHSRRGGQMRPVVSGTSLAGAVRARALRIANTLLPGEAAGELVGGMFGRCIGGRQDKPSGSRVVAREGELAGSRDLVQSRVKIDRFTGGSYPAALFTEQPAFGGEGSRLTLSLELRQPREAEIGLLLLVLKDLWTGDLPLGGESSVGRGRLKGLSATLTGNLGGEPTTWELVRSGEGLTFAGDGDVDTLEGFVRALHMYGRSA